MSNSNRASLLAGLRTGGVRIPSQPIPHTAAPNAISFNITAPSNVADEDDDQVLEMPSNHFSNPSRAFPMTAAVDGPGNRFSSQQQLRGMNPNSLPFSPAFPRMGGMAAQQAQQAQAQALQLQIQLEMMMQAQAQAQAQQQYQAELFAQAQRQQAKAPVEFTRRQNPTFNPPASAGPLSNSFDLRTATLSAQMRRANLVNEQLRSQVPTVTVSDDHGPMTAALGGKFGSRSSSLSAAPVTMSRFTPDEGDAPLPPTPGSTTVISGGTSLGNPASNNITPNTPSKSDTASSWRRGGSKGNSVLGNRSLTSPSVKITPPPVDRVSPPPKSSATISTPTTGKARPVPLRFNPSAQKPLHAVAIGENEISVEVEAENDDGYSSSSSAKSAGSANSNSSPTTPSSNEMMVPLSPREEASKKLYEGLGIGRPRSAVAEEDGRPSNASSTSVNELVVPSIYVPAPTPSANQANYRIVSQPMRQPRGPPSGMDELTPKNFATRIRRQAIGGLGMLMGARERRDLVEVY